MPGIEATDPAEIAGTPSNGATGSKELRANG